MLRAAANKTQRKVMSCCISVSHLRNTANCGHQDPTEVNQQDTMEKKCPCTTDKSYWQSAEQTTDKLLSLVHAKINFLEICKDLELLEINLLSFMSAVPPPVAIWKHGCRPTAI